MQTSDVRRKFIDFYVKRGHKEIPSAPLVPLNDPTTLFTSSGMQPLVPYLLGQPHPQGKRIVDSQKSFRSQDIEEVGDNRHTTFFEMLGNWSLGDYFKEKQLPWFFEFLTQELGLEPKRLYVTVFEGNESVPKDTESISIWQEIFSQVGIDAQENERIFTYSASKNWWSRSGEPDNMPAGEPGGPDSEVFFDFGEHLRLHENSPWKNEKCHPNCDCGRFLEIGNSVFMQYVKQTDESLKELSDKVVDFGGGLERLVAATNDNPDVFRIDLFTSIIRIIEGGAKAHYGESLEATRAMRIIADHVRAATMIMADGVAPSNKTQGYVVRRLLRRSIKYAKQISAKEGFVADLGQEVLRLYHDTYPVSSETENQIIESLKQEETKFNKMIGKGLKEIEKYPTLTGTLAFKLYETYGFPWEMTEEIARERGQKVEKGEFENEFQKHQELSRTAAKGMFKGGLADQSTETTRLHTAHHLLLAALQKEIDPNIKQRGSNITAERLRIDFSLNRALTDEEKQKVEELVNQKIAESLPVTRVEMKKEAAEKVGAQMEFGAKYPDTVSVYFVGLKPDVKPEDATSDDYFSAEFCGGPHVTNTSEIGTGGKKFKIVKEESVGSGVRRIKGVLI
ncbi:alanine--tRNA ligase [Candidatus Microgenomates bacterium]|nr:MAG: alanine--tRNA ligase [Candidatus Microgenomates bacterium]